MSNSVIDLRARFGKKPPVPLPDVDWDNGQAFIWVGENVPCDGCHKTGRNLNKSRMCVDCGPLGSIVTGVTRPYPVGIPICVPWRDMKVHHEGVGYLATSYTRVFKFEDAKWWCVTLYGKMARTSWGAMGKSGQTKQTLFASKAHAMEFEIKMTKSKLRKGYIEVTPHAAARKAFDAAKEGSLL